uniref:Uncharacterized protein n=1 Tax=Timema shepardi TaxID=629360 RepID=A0A7R9B724_TIMSH|nr:unnamed protein product [Timema shepardi]
MRISECVTKIQSVDIMMVHGCDHAGNSIHIRITRRRHRVTDVWLHVQLQDGTHYQLPGTSTTTPQFCESMFESVIPEPITNSISWSDYFLKSYQLQFLLWSLQSVPITLVLPLASLISSLET